jgi:hypothetical protein
MKVKKEEAEAATWNSLVLRPPHQAAATWWAFSPGL